MNALPPVAIAMGCGFVGGLWPFVIFYLVGRRIRRRQAEAFVARLMGDQP